MRLATGIAACLTLLSALPATGQAEPLPFHHKVEVYRAKDGAGTAFSLRLEQPFLAEEFEKSNYLRLVPLDRNAYLIYPKETRFQQKHAEFHGRLRGEGKAKLRLSYEIVSENLDGSRKVDVRQADIDVALPTAPGGPRSIFTAWAKQQNAHFLDLLNYYPDESFFQYCLLQSRDRYGVTPSFIKPVPSRDHVETNLYDVLTGSLAIQEMLQHRALHAGPSRGDQTIHISNIDGPALSSLDYARLLAEKSAKQQVQPKVQEITRLIPKDQYFLHFNSVRSAGELFDLANSWGDSLLRLFTVRAQDNRLHEKFEDQLCLRRGPLTNLFADGVVTELAITGADPFFLEGTDVTLLFRLKRPELFEKAAVEWLAAVKKKYPEVVEREFNYRGHKVVVRYTNDRMVSSFLVRHADYAIYSNSHGAIRKIIDVATGKVPRLYDALDYRYATTILPPSTEASSGYLFASEDFVKRMIGPEAKIAEKRRIECFNNLVMLNNASLFYRLENGTSPASLTDLVQGQFVDLSKVVCPHGGAYAFDAKHDTCTCSLHNRLKYLTPNTELPVLKVSADEQEEYKRYKERYQAFWQTVFDPIAIRITVAPRVKLEVCVLPFNNGSLYTTLKNSLDTKPRALDTQRIASSAVGSLVAVPGRKHIAEFLRMVPGVPEVLQADPTLTDLAWIGDRAGLHLCDGSPILEIDPLRLRNLDLDLRVFKFKATVPEQSLVAAGVWLASMPAYLTFDVEDRDKASRLLEQLSAKIFLQRGEALGLPTALDAYRLPDYKKHRCYVLSFRLYTVKLRMHVALVGNQLVAATKPEVLREVIDASANPEAKEAATGHMLLRLNRRALGRLQNDLELYWSEQVRLACHRNTISIYNLLKLYEVPIAEVPRLAEAKYGVAYFCPDHGAYEWDTRRDQVRCSVHGNRQDSRQNPRLDRKSSFAEFIDNLSEIVATLRFQDEALIATVEIARQQPAEK